MKKIKKGYFAALLLLALTFAAVFSSPKDITASAEAPELPVIIIDAGHGGVDGGAVGADGTAEKGINLSIALRLRDVLSAAGYKVVMTREDDRSIHDSSAVTVREQKVSDLHNRLAMTELFENCVLVSIHQNYIDSPSVFGAQVFFSPNHPDSELLAGCIQQNLNSSVNKKPKEIKAAGKNLFLFYNAKVPAVLAECGFMSNPSELALLKTEEYQDKLVYLIYKGLLEYTGGKRGS